MGTIGSKMGRHFANLVKAYQQPDDILHIEVRALLIILYLAIRAACPELHYV